MSQNITINRKRPNDKFSILSNDILQDPDISMDAQGVATYILSLPSDWKIHPKQIWKSKNIGRDRVYAAFKELIKLGYMKKDTIYKNNIKKDVTYQLSAFKEFLRFPGFQDTGIQDIYKELTITNINDDHRSNENKDYLNLLKTEDEKQLFDRISNIEVSSGDSVDPREIYFWIKEFRSEEIMLAIDSYMDQLKRFRKTPYRQPKSMGGYIRGILNSNRKCKTLDDDFNKNKAFALQCKYHEIKEVDYENHSLKVNKDHIVFGNIGKDHDFSIPHGDFIAYVTGSMNLTFYNGE